MIFLVKIYAHKKVARRTFSFKSCSSRLLSKKFYQFNNFKMKLYSFLLTLVLVNISAEDDPDTKLRKEIYLTNRAIEKAFKKNVNGRDGLEYVIEKMVNDGPTLVSELKNYYSCFAMINYMIALPANTEVCDYIPESGWNAPTLTRGVYYQHVMRHEIRTALGIDDVAEAYDIQGWEKILLNTSYEDLVRDRLRRVKPALDNIITRIFSKYADSNFVPEVVLGQNGTVIRDVTLYSLCRLMGINMSITSPETYIKDVVVDPINKTCMFDDGTTKRLYNKMNNKLSIVKPGNSSVESIKDQLALILRSFRIG